MRFVKFLLCFFGFHPWDESDSYGWRSSEGRVIEVDPPKRVCTWCHAKQYGRYLIIADHVLFTKDWA